MWNSQGRSSLGKAERGEVTFPLMTTYREKSKSEHLSFDFSKTEPGYLVLVLQHLASGEIIGRLGELILMLENLIK